MTLAPFDIEYKKSFRVCTVNDQAIDVTKSNLSEYGRTCDEKHLVFHSGQQPTWFHLRWLSQIKFANILDSSDSNITKLQLAFAYCVEKIDNPPGPASVLLPTTPIPGLGYNIFNPDDLEDVFDLPTIFWVGGVAEQRHFLLFGTEPTYSLPHAFQKYIASKKLKKPITSPSVGPKSRSKKHQPSRTAKKQKQP